MAGRRLIGVMGVAVLEVLVQYNSVLGPTQDKDMVTTEVETASLVVANPVMEMIVMTIMNNPHPHIMLLEDVLEVDLVDVKRPNRHKAFLLLQVEQEQVEQEQEQEQQQQQEQVEQVEQEQ